MAEKLSLFTFIFLSALPGRTTFVLIMLAASGNTWRIFWGAALAFLVQVFISVLAGNALALVPIVYIQITAGFLFLFFARKFWMDSKNEITSVNPRTLHSLKSVFTLIFIAEFGDVSQLAIATAASQAPSKILVFILGVLALWLITFIALFAGKRLSKLIKPNLIQKIASFTFAFVAAYLIYRGTLSILKTFHQL